jgi:hypothetical protein
MFIAEPMVHPKLILHVDVSESILLANPFTGSGVRETLNISVAKVWKSMHVNACCMWVHGLIAYYMRRDALKLHH